MKSKNIISRADAFDLVGKSHVRFIDASWYLPAQNRNGRKEYNAWRIPGATFFDLDEISDKDTDLPHMLPTQEEFAQAMGQLGISETHKINVYDGPGLFSAPRVWWTLKTMGAKDVMILEGGMDGWRKDDLPVETGTPPTPEATTFRANFNAEKVAHISDILANQETRNVTVIDARPADRFAGKGTEPRPGLRGGHIPRSKSLPSGMVSANGILKDTQTLERFFRDLNIDDNTPTITSCGSGVTAAILTLALEETGRTNNRVYDGSWAEYGQADGPEIWTDEH